jgi:chaperone BCS1
MDVWVKFKNATKWQAEGIFKCFFPSAPAPAPTPSPSSAATTDDGGAKSKGGTDKGRRKQHVQGVPLLSAEELESLAQKFAEEIPEEEMSVASLQGYLLKNKVGRCGCVVRRHSFIHRCVCWVQTRPRECVEEVHEWVKTERETRERLKKEKEEVRS